MIKENISRIKNTISEAGSRKNLDTASLRLVAVTKKVPAAAVIEAAGSGLTEIGENRVQEAQEKFARMGAHGGRLTKHLIGHLQTNKAKKAVELFDMIQSVDSARLAAEIDRFAAAAGKVQDCLAEVKVSEEPEKYGCPPGKLRELVEYICGLKNMRLCGLMAIAPLLDTPEKTRPYFARVRELFDGTRQDFPGINAHFSILSMGMTDDFVVAVEEGSNMVRLGRAIFGQQNE